MSKKFLISVIAVFLILYAISSVLTNKVFADYEVFEKWNNKDVLKLAGKQ